MIPPDAQRGMAKRAGAKTFEVPGSHAVYVSNPKAVVKIIEDAAQAKKSGPGQEERLNFEGSPVRFFRRAAAYHCRIVN